MNQLRDTEIVELGEYGFSARLIARRVRCEVHTVYSVMHKYGRNLGEYRKGKTRVAKTALALVIGAARRRRSAKR